MSHGGRSRGYIVIFTVIGMDFFQRGFRITNTTCRLRQQNRHTLLGDEMEIRSDNNSGRSLLLQISSGLLVFLLHYKSANAELFISRQHYTFRGGSTTFVLPQEQLYLNQKSHSAEIEENSKEGHYHMGPCATDFEVCDCRGYNVGSYVLADFNDTFRKSPLGDELIQVVPSGQILDCEECNRVIQMAEDHFRTVKGGKGRWTKLPSGRFEIAGSWIKDIPGVNEWFNEALKHKIFPALAQLFSDVVNQGDAASLCVQSAYLFKYTPETGEKTDMHMDSSLLSFTILLNDPAEFEGGGTFFEALGEKGGIVEMKQGEVTFRPSGLRHRGEPITKGERYVIGGFVTVAGEDSCEHTRQLLSRGTEALANGNTADAKDLFEMAKDNSPNFSEIYMSYAHVLRKFADDEGALANYKRAFEINSRSADAAFMVGVMHAELGNDEEAFKMYKIASELNEYDGDAWYRQGLVYGRKGDTVAERKMYHKAVSVQPNHADAWCNLGVSYGENREVTKEVECYEMALAIDPENTEAKENAKSAYYYLGIAAYQEGNHDKCLAYFQRILNGIAPEDPTIIAAYNGVLDRKRKADEAGNK